MLGERNPSDIELNLVGGDVMTGCICLLGLLIEGAFNILQMTYVSVAQTKSPLRLLSRMCVLYLRRLYKLI